MVFFKCFKSNTITILAKENDSQDRGTTLKIYAPLTGLKALALPTKDNSMHIKSWSSEVSWKVANFVRSNTEREACTPGILILNPSHHARDSHPASFKLLGDHIRSGAMAWNDALSTTGEAVFDESYWEWLEDVLGRSKHVLTSMGLYHAVYASLFKVGKANGNETLLYCFSPLPLLLLAAFPGAGIVASLFEPFVELVKSFGLPGWLVHWGHLGNMAVVLFAMGGYGTYLGYWIRFSDDVEKANAKDLHPKLLAGMFFFFTLGAAGGVTSLLTSDKPIFESPYAVTGLIGLNLVTIQTILPALFEGKSELKTVHEVFGIGTMTLFVVLAALGLQLGLSY
ncbi:uncharacterized protein [Pyrus communis]|uniref:uncharacterized protein n=1 Tax=Pyrus communis TaxID=23211 RepID=UPI0035C03FF2